MKKCSLIFNKISCHFSDTFNLRNYSKKRNKLYHFRHDAFAQEAYVFASGRTQLNVNRNLIIQQDTYIHDRLTRCTYFFLRCKKRRKRRRPEGRVESDPTIGRGGTADVT